MPRSIPQTVNNSQAIEEARSTKPTNCNGDGHGHTPNAPPGRKGDTSNGKPPSVLAKIDHLIQEAHQRHWDDPWIPVLPSEEEEYARLSDVVNQVRQNMGQFIREEPTEEAKQALGAFLRLLPCACPEFPLRVFPSLLRRYITAYARSIHCPADLLAVPLLAVAGAAIGSSGRRLKVKDGWTVTSCLWTACLADSGAGKTPALNAVESFYEAKQAEEYQAYSDALEAHKKNPKHPKPGPYPTLKLTDTTIESLRSDLMGGPVLFSRDELGAWCHQMGQYKQGNADRFDWCSFWSHSAVHIGRKTSERVYVKEPFVAVTGTMVPASARELNYRGRADDGFVHRMLLSFPRAMMPVATLEGVPDELSEEYTRRMSHLFDPPEGERTLTFDPNALDMLLGWADEELYAELRCMRDPETGEPRSHPLRPDQDAPGWVVSKYRKLYENCLRLCLVLHELWRVASEDRELGKPAKCKGDTTPLDEEEELRECQEVEPDPETWGWDPDPRDFYGRRIEWQDTVVDCLTVERAIAVVEYFKGHIFAVQDLLGEEVDDADRVYNRLRGKGNVTVREVIRQTTYKSADQARALLAEWEKRGYGKVTHPRKNQVAFTFAEADTSQEAGPDEE